MHILKKCSSNYYLFWIHAPKNAPEKKTRWVSEGCPMSTECEVIERGFGGCARARGRIWRVSPGRVPPSKATLSHHGTGWCDAIVMVLSGVASVTRWVTIRDTCYKLLVKKFRETLRLVDFNYCKMSYFDSSRISTFTNRNQKFETRDLTRFFFNWVIFLTTTYFNLTEEG